MTTKAIEAGARAICQSQHGHTNWFETGEGAYAFRARAQACIEAAIASGELVPASAVAAERERCAQIVERIGYQEREWPLSEQQQAKLAAAHIRSTLEPASGEYVLVPRKPTDAMIAAGCEKLGWSNPKDESAIDDVTGIYRAMLTAATSNGSGK